MKVVLFGTVIALFLASGSAALAHGFVPLPNKVLTGVSHLALRQQSLTLQASYSFHGLSQLSGSGKVLAQLYRNVAQTGIVKGATTGVISSGQTQSAVYFETGTSGQFTLYSGNEIDAYGSNPLNNGANGPYVSIVPSTFFNIGKGTGGGGAAIPGMALYSAKLTGTGRILYNQLNTLAGTSTQLGRQLAGNPVSGQLYGTDYTPYTGTNTYSNAGIILIAFGKNPIASAQAATLTNPSSSSYLQLSPHVRVNITNGQLFSTYYAPAGGGLYASLGYNFYVFGSNPLNVGLVGTHNITILPSQFINFLH